MHRFLGLAFVLLGVVGGWWLGKPAESQTRPEPSPAAAWRYYRDQIRAAREFKHDIEPHPAWVAFAVAAASFGILTAAASDRRQALAAAVWLRAHPSVRWN
jgi:hypothetical protein